MNNTNTEEQEFRTAYNMENAMYLNEHKELRRLADCCPELNLCNYLSDDVDELNAWAIEVVQCINRVLHTSQGKK